MDTKPSSVAAAPLWAALLWAAALGLCAALLAGHARAAADEPAWAAQVRELAARAGAAAAGPAARIEIELGSLDPRLKLAPCARVEAHLPQGTRAWGKTRVGLRCLEGPTPWNVYLPVTVKAFGPALVAKAPLPAGSVLAAADWQEAQIDLAAGSSPAVRGEQAWGRSLARAFGIGEPLRAADLKARSWFAAGDTVRIVAVGSGFAVSGEGQALAAGIEGQAVRVRTEGGRIVSGTAVADRRVELAP